MKPEVPVDSKVHRGMFKTLVLLRIDAVKGPIYFIVEDSAAAKWDDALDSTYLYEEHNCPTNFIRIPAVFTPDDGDPHGLFKHVRTVWMPREYVDGEQEPDAVLRRLFPETMSAERAKLAADMAAA